MHGFQDAPAWEEDGVEFRPAWWWLALSMIAICFAGCLGAFLAFVAWGSAESSFGFQVFLAVIGGGIVAFFTFGSVYLLLTCLLHRLSITDQAIRSAGIFRTREVDLDSVDRLEWRQDGTLTFHDKSGTTKTPLYLFGPVDRAEIIRFVHEELPESIQKGWPSYEPHVPGGTTWHVQRQRGKRHYILVRGLLMGLAVGVGLLITKGGLKPFNPKLVATVLVAFGLGGTCVGAYRWKANEEAYEAAESDLPFRRANSGADHRVLRATALALVAVVPMGFVMTSLFKQIGEGRWKRTYDAGMGALWEGRHADAAALLKTAIAQAEPFGDRDERLANSLSALASAYSNMARHAEAEPPMKRALAIRENIFGPDHLEVGRSLEGMAWIHCNSGRYADAERLARQASAIMKRSLPAGSVELARSLDDLGWFLYRKGKDDEAESLYKEALPILEKAGNDGRYDLAACLNRLGILDQARKRPREAAPLFERALALREEVLGPGHPDVAESLANLASVLRDEKRFDQSRPLYERSIGIFEKALGPDHPRLAWTLDNFAKQEAAEGHTDRAEALFARALAIFEKALGPDHPEVVQGLEPFAAFLRKNGRVSEAEAMEARARAIREASKIPAK